MGLVGSALGWVGIWWFGVVVVFCLFAGCCNIEALQFGVFGLLDLRTCLAGVCIWV